ncbi:hypothetical protein T265_15678, partial [Opisthorchis viverrini]
TVKVLFLVVVVVVGTFCGAVVFQYPFNADLANLITASVGMRLPGAMWLEEHQLCSQLKAKRPEKWVEGLFLRCRLEKKYNNMAILAVQVDLSIIARQYRLFPTDVLSWHLNDELNAHGRTCATIVDIPGRRLFKNDQQFWITGPASPDLCEIVKSLKVPGIWIEECAGDLYDELMFQHERLKTYGLLMNETARKESVMEVVYTLNRGQDRCTYNGFLTAQYE